MESTPAKLAFKFFDPEGGAEDNPPIIFTHGITASKENWGDFPQKAANATRRRVYAVDARNHGESEWRDYYTFDCNVDDLLHFMDSLKIPKAVIVGHSMGGIIGIRMALQKPERVEKLLVEDMYVKRVPQAACDLIIMYIRLANEALEKLPAGADQETAQKFVVEYVYKNVPPELLQKISKRKWTDIDLKITANGRYAFTYNASAIEKLLQNIEESFSDNTGIYKGPTSFIYGGLSPYLVGKEEDHIKQFFPNAEFVGIEKASHRVHTDCPEEFTAALFKFLLKN